MKQFRGNMIRQQPAANSKKLSLQQCYYWPVQRCSPQCTTAVYRCLMLSHLNNLGNTHMIITRINGIDRTKMEEMNFFIQLQTLWILLTTYTAKQTDILKPRWLFAWFISGTMGNTLQNIYKTWPSRWVFYKQSQKTTFPFIQQTLVQYDVS